MLTKERLGTLAASLALPVGFTERGQMLVNMFRAAAEMERVPELIAALVAEADRWEARYVEWSREYPASAAVWDEWRGRLAGLRALLGEMSTAASAASAVEARDP